eukprot:9496649-Pyramimonas_sp.AAC.1
MTWLFYFALKNQTADKQMRAWAREDKNTEEDKWRRGSGGRARREEETEEGEEAEEEEEGEEEEENEEDVQRAADRGLGRLVEEGPRVLELDLAYGIARGEGVGWRRREIGGGRRRQCKVQLELDVESIFPCMQMHVIVLLRQLAGRPRENPEKAQDRVPRWLQARGTRSRTAVDRPR